MGSCWQGKHRAHNTLRDQEKPSNPQLRSLGVNPQQGRGPVLTPPCCDSPSLHLPDMELVSHGETCNSG